MPEVGNRSFLIGYQSYELFDVYITPRDTRFAGRAAPMGVSVVYITPLYSAYGSALLTYAGNSWGLTVSQYCVIVISVPPFPA